MSSWSFLLSFFHYDSTIAFNMLVCRSSQQYEVVHVTSAQSFHASQMREEEIAQMSRKGNWMEHLEAATMTVLLDVWSILMKRCSQQRVCCADPSSTPDATHYLNLQNSNWSAFLIKSHMRESFRSFHLRCQLLLQLNHPFTCLAVE